MHDNYEGDDYDDHSHNNDDCYDTEDYDSDER